jgi:general secretion pathway protein M
MSAWWESLQPRERTFIAGGALALAGFLIIWFGARPLFISAGETRMRVAEKTILLADLRTAAAELGNRPARGSRLPSSNESLVVIVDKSTREAGLAGTLKRNRPVGEDEIQIRLENAPFDQVMAWLGLLDSQYGIEIDSGAFESTSEIGKIQASLTLKRAQK